MDLTGILSHHFIVAVTLAASSTVGKPLTEQDLQKVLHACDVVEQLEFNKRRV